LNTPSLFRFTFPGVEPTSAISAAMVCFGTGGSSRVLLLLLSSGGAERRGFLRPDAHEASCTARVA
jgi:hypothetical protein